MKHLLQVIVFTLLCALSFLSCNTTKSASPIPTSESDTEDTSLNNSQEETIEEEIISDPDTTSIEITPDSTTDPTEEDTNDSTPSEEIDNPVTCEPGWQETSIKEGELYWEIPASGSLHECTSTQYFAISVQNQRFLLTASGLPSSTRIDIQDSHSNYLGALYSVDGEVSIEFETSITGELTINLTRPDGSITSDYSLLLSCLENCEMETTRYPIVLIHGFAGTDQYFGILEYFYGVREDLTARGYRVYTPATDPIAPSESRASQLGEAIDAILAETGASKAHLIAHSQGGLDVRILLSALGYEDKVASVTTIASPHHGLRVIVADLPFSQNMTQEYMDGEFLEIYPEVESIPRFSWAGITCRPLDFECQEENNGEVIVLLLLASYIVVKEAHSDDAFGGANDGLVPVSSSQWGEFLGILPADHWDEVGQLADRRTGPFDHIGFYRDESRRLRQLELEEQL